MWRVVLVVLFSVHAKSVVAQAGIVEAVKNAVAKVIKAVDLKVQRMQNETIWLQNAQKTMENALSKLKLQEIGEWVEKQRVLYDDYFQELYKVKAAIATYHRVKDLMEKQIRLVQEYKRAYALFKNDEHFSAEEIAFMEEVYEGILSESLRNLDQVGLVINAFAVQMDDGARIRIINEVAENIDKNYDAVRSFNIENATLSIQRATELEEAQGLRKMYGLE